MDGWIDGFCIHIFQIEVLSIGPLIAYTMVAISVLITRYQPGAEDVVHSKAAQLERTDQWLQSRNIPVYLWRYSKPTET